MKSNGRETLKLGPSGTKDDSFPSSRQQMIRPKHMLGSLNKVGIIIPANSPLTNHAFFCSD